MAKSSGDWFFLPGMQPTDVVEKSTCGGSTWAAADREMNVLARTLQGENRHRDGQGYNKRTTRMPRARGAGGGGAMTHSQRERDARRCKRPPSNLWDPNVSAARQRTDADSSTPAAHLHTFIPPDLQTSVPTYLNPHTPIPPYLQTSIPPSCSDEQIHTIT